MTEQAAARVFFLRSSGALSRPFTTVDVRKTRVGRVPFDGSLHIKLSFANRLMVQQRNGPANPRGVLGALSKDDLLWRRRRKSASVGGRAAAAKNVRGRCQTLESVTVSHFPRVGARDIN